MAKFTVPSSPSKSVINVSNFVGVDFTNSPTAVSNYQSPNAVNMIRDVPGKVRKRTGYKLVHSFGSNKINGCHYLVGSEYVIHAGTNLYKKNSNNQMVSIYSNMANNRSLSWQIENKLFIADGKKLIVFDGTTAQPVENAAYIPTLTIAKQPSGGGTSYEPFNLIGSGFTELFAGTESDTEFQLTFGNLENTIKVKVLDSDGNWNTVTNYTFNAEAGIVNFAEAPGKSPITGEDNVRITAHRNIEGYADRVNKCRFGIMYGLNGQLDRLFLSGNPDYINYDWYSGQYDGTYFPDTGYSVLGTSRSAIMGYSIINNYLATHKDEKENDQCIILREGTTYDDEIVFRVKSTLQGNGAISNYCFGYLSTEPLYLSRSGVYAVTTPDSGEKYSQNRSFYLNGKLLEEEDLENAYACVFNDMYWICINNAVYVLDGLQSITAAAEPYSTRQYAGFYLTDIPANVMWEYRGELFIGTTDGKVCKFAKDKDALESYSDYYADENGEESYKAIHCLYETPDFDDNMFYHYKTFRYLAVRLQSAISTSVKIYGQKKGVWALINDDDASCRYFTFASINFAKFSFRTDQTPTIVPSKLRIKKVDKARFRFENNEINEPFGIFDFAIEFVENGNVK